MKDTTMGKFLIVQPNLGLHLLPTHVGFSTKTKKKYIGYDFFPSLLRLYSHTLVFPNLYKLYLNLVFLPQKVINQYSHFYRLCSNILNLCKFNLVFFNINRPFTQYFQPLLTLHLSISPQYFGLYRFHSTQVFFYKPLQSLPNNNIVVDSHNKLCASKPLQKNNILIVLLSFPLILDFVWTNSTAPILLT